VPAGHWRPSQALNRRDELILARLTLDHVPGENGVCLKECVASGALASVDHDLLILDLIVSLPATLGVYRWCVAHLVQRLSVRK
jgi:hypothetical protein